MIGSGDAPEATFSKKCRVAGIDYFGRENAMRTALSPFKSHPLGKTYLVVVKSAFHQHLVIVQDDVCKLFLFVRFSFDLVPSKVPFGFPVLFEIFGHLFRQFGV